MILAVRLSKSPDHTSAALVDLLSDIYWKDHAFAQEARILLDRVEWDHADMEVRRMIWPHAGTMCNTKFPNEDVFNTLRDQQRGNKNKRMDRHRAWHHANVSPFLCSNSGASNEDLEAGRFFRHLHLPDEDSMIPLEVSAARIGEGIFKTAGHLVRESVKSKQLLLDKKDRAIDWQPAGPLADRRSSSAAALLQVDMIAEFRT